MTEEEFEECEQAERRKHDDKVKELGEMTIRTDNTSTFKNALHKIVELEKEKVELKAQIEKMKCCGNCGHFDFNEPNYCYKGVYRERQYVCSKWEFGN